MELERIYRVTTEGDCEGKSPHKILGYARGDEDAIKAFYDDRKEYKIFLEPIAVVTITRETIDDKRKLLEELTQLNEEKAQLEKRLSLLEGVLGR